jgi:hypothetical protein
MRMFPVGQVFPRLAEKVLFPAGSVPGRSAKAETVFKRDYPPRGGAVNASVTVDVR